MGFLHKLWDETLAGPTPDSGLGKLRKYEYSFYSARSPPVSPDPVLPVSRSITLIKTHPGLRNIFAGPGSEPESPLGPSTPVTPITPQGGTPREEFKKIRRRKSPAEASESAEHPSPTPYDWIALSALER